MPGITMPPVASISARRSGAVQPDADRGDPLADHQHVGVGQHRGASSMVSTMPLRKTDRPASASVFGHRTLLGPRTAGRSSVSRQLMRQCRTYSGHCRVSKAHLTCRSWSGQTRSQSGRLSVKRTRFEVTRDVGQRRRRARWPGCWWPTSRGSSPGPYATMLLADLGADVIKVEGPRGDDTRTWMPPVRDGESTYYLGINRNKRSIALDFGDAGRRRRRAGAGAPGRRRDRELPAGRAGPVRAGLRDAWRRPTHRSSTPRSAASAPARGAATPGYDLMVQAISGLMSLTGDPDGPPYRAGISVFDVMAGLHATIGILAALHTASRDRPRPARRGQPALLGAVRAGQPLQRVRRRRRRPVPDGQRHPSLFPYEPLPSCRRRPDRHRRATTASSASCARCSACRDLADDPRFGRNQDRTAHREELRPLLVERLQTRTKDDGSATSSPPACRAGRSTPSTAGWRSPRRSGSTRWSRSAAGRRCRSVRNPITLSETPADYQLPAARLDEHGEEIRAWLTRELA